MTAAYALTLLARSRAAALARARGLDAGAVCGMPIGATCCMRDASHTGGCIPIPHGYWPLRAAS